MGNREKTELQGETTMLWMGFDVFFRLCRACFGGRDPQMKEAKLPELWGLG